MIFRRNYGQFRFRVPYAIHQPKALWRGAGLHLQRHDPVGRDMHSIEYTAAVGNRSTTKPIHYIPTSIALRAVIFMSTCAWWAFILAQLTRPRVGWRLKMQTAEM
jgi:hypothetical protein